MTGKTKAEIIVPPNLLRDRVVLGPPRTSDLLAADRAIERLSRDFMLRLQDCHKAIETSLAALEARPDDAACKRDLYKQTYWLKGEASTFDYMLLSTIGDDLCRFLDRQESMTNKSLRVIGIYVNAMKRLINNRLADGSNKRDIPMIRALHDTNLQMGGEDIGSFLAACKSSG